MTRRSHRPKKEIIELREIEVSERIHHCWRREYGTMRIDEVKQPKEPEPGRLII